MKLSKAIYSNEITNITATILVKLRVEHSTAKSSNAVLQSSDQYRVNIRSDFIKCFPCSWTLDQVADESTLLHQSRCKLSVSNSRTISNSLID